MYSAWLVLEDDPNGVLDFANVWDYDSVTIQDLTLSGQPAALAVGEVEPFSFVEFSKNAVLFEQVLDNLLLMPVHPAGEDQ